MADNHTVVCHFAFKKLYKKCPSQNVRGIPYYID